MRYARPRFDLQFDLNPGAEAVDDADQAIQGEASEVGVADTGEVGRRDPGCVSSATAHAWPGTLGVARTFQVHDIRNLGEYEGDLDVSRLRHSHHRAHRS